MTGNGGWVPYGRGVGLGGREEKEEEEGERGREGEGERGMEGEGEKEGGMKW